MMLPIDTERLFSTDTTDDNTLFKSLDDLITNQNTLLSNSNLFKNAFTSGLYHEPWKEAGVRVDQLDGRDGLLQLPYADDTNLLKMLETRKSINNALLAKPRLWQISRGTNGQKKWLPITLNDVAFWFKRIRRLSSIIGLQPNDPEKLVLAVNEPKPKVSNAIPYLWEQVDYILGGGRLEWLIVAMEMLHRNKWDKFSIQKQPEWYMSSVHDAFQLAEKMNLYGHEDVKSALHSFERGFFWGEYLDGEDNLRSQIESIYGLPETFSLYLSAECLEMYAECPAHDGLHLWMDSVIHEILLDNGDTKFVDQASPGEEGEYVMTTFYEALPLVRYRTGDRVKVVSVEPCKCSITHPRVNFIGRNKAPSRS